MESSDIKSAQDENYPLIYAKKTIFQIFYKEIIRQAKLAGYSTFQFFMLLLKFMFTFLQTYRFGEHYKNYEIITDKTKLQDIIQALNIAINMGDLNQRTISIRQQVSRFYLLKVIIKDKYVAKPNFVSLQEKENAYWKFQEFQNTIILDHSGKSSFRRPSFFVSSKFNKLTIAIRGTTNSDDIFTDLDYTPEQHYNYNFHSGFFAGAQYVQEVLNQSGILNREQDILIIGHSMGASISVILTFLLRKDNYNAQTINCGQSCVGDFNFSVLAKQFCVTIVNGFDFIPVISYHAEMVMLMRMKLQKMKLKRKNTLTKQSIEDFDNQTYIGQEDENFQFCEQKCRSLGFNPEIRILSRYLTRMDDFFIAGKVYQFIKGQLYEVSVHDISDIYFTVQGVFDHIGYHYLIDELILISQSQ